VVLLAVSALSLSADRARGQERTCTWDECALRVEGDALLEGSRSEYRGWVGEPAADVAVLLAGPDSAAAYARRIELAIPRSSLWSALGNAGRGLALAAWIHYTLADDAAEGWAWTAAVLTPVSASALTHARRQGVIADRSIRRSVWWYNRQFAAPADGLPPRTRMLALPNDYSGWDLAPLAGGILGAAVTSVFFDSPGYITFGAMLGTSFGGQIAERRLHPDDPD
jgi:hypothetical protein